MWDTGHTVPSERCTVRLCIHYKGHFLVCVVNVARHCKVNHVNEPFGRNRLVVRSVTLPDLEVRTPVIAILAFALTSVWIENFVFVALQVFPELQEWCETRRFHLVTTDLQWVSFGQMFSPVVSGCS